MKLEKTKDSNGNGLLWLGIEHVQTGRMDGVYLAMLVLTALAAFEAVMPLPTAFKQLGECIEAGRRMFRLTDQAAPHFNPSPWTDG